LKEQNKILMNRFLYKITTVFILLLVFASCQNDENSNTKKEKIQQEENLIEYKNGIYTEYYPGRKKIKIQGAQDSNKVRNGKWVFLSETGNELSITYFDHGKREGHTIVKYPNGSLHYVGEYLHDEMVGVWKFYDEKGNLKNEKDYGYPKK